MICHSCGYSHGENICPRGSMAYRDEMPKIKTTKECIAEAIADRDKWWLGLLQEVNEANDLKDLQERFAHLLRYVADLGIKREVGQ